MTKMRMKNGYPVPINEKQRLKALHSYNILDSISEKEYDAITKIAARICDVPASLITFLDKDRQWFKSTLGIDMTETPRQLSFCNYTILDPENILVVPDLRTDERFNTNPLVTGEPYAVFYAGAPLVTPDGYVLGSICVLDGKKNNLNQEQQDALVALAQQVVTKMELKIKLIALKKTEQNLKKLNKKLKDFAHLASHDMKTPIANISLLSKSFKTNYCNEMDKGASEFLDLIDRSAKELLIFIDDILLQSLKINNDKKAKAVDSFTVIHKVIDLIAAPGDIEIKVSGEFPKIRINKTELQQVFQNLITNAIKYNDKKQGIIKISSRSDKTNHYFDVADNGMGIEKQHLLKIFKEKQTLDQTDRYGNKGTGIGLAAIKNIISTNGGKITVSSEKSVGSVFKISLPVSA